MSRWLQVWDCSQIEEPCELQVLSGHTDRVSSVRFSPCGKYIATTCYDKVRMAAWLPCVSGRPLGVILIPGPVLPVRQAVAA